MGGQCMVCQPNSTDLPLISLSNFFTIKVEGRLFHNYLAGKFPPCWSKSAALPKVNQNNVFLRRNCMRQQQLVVQTTAKFLLAFSSRTRSKLPHYHSIHPLYQSTTTLYTRALPLHLSRDYHHPTIAFVARFLSNIGSFKRVYTVSRTRGYVTNTKKCEFCV